MPRGAEDSYGDERSGPTMTNDPTNQQQTWSFGTVFSFVLP
jgi:hypothetical protein